MHAEVNKHNKQKERQRCPNRNSGLWPPLRRIERISRFEQGVANRDLKASVAPALDHCQQAFMHLLDG
jgi:hypothetical protein